MYKIECPTCGEIASFGHYNATWVMHRAICHKCNTTFHFKIKTMKVTECTYVDEDYGAISK